MTTDDHHLDFPELAHAAHRLELDERELVEAMIRRLDNGLGYWQALHAVVVEAAQRRGMYEGEIKARIDSGDIYGIRPALMPETPARMLEAVKDGVIDVFDALAVTGARQEAERRNGGEQEAKRRRDARLAAVKVGWVGTR